MITRESISEAAVACHTSDLNIAREYAQHVFLRALYLKAGSEGLLFKGGTALRIVYKSPRFSEDLDFSAYGLQRDHVENLFVDVLADLEAQGFAIELDRDSHPTTGGYYGEARMSLYEYVVTLEINVNIRGGALEGEYKQINGDFAPNYGLLMLPETALVGEKIAAMLDRKKPRDFYDLYFMLRSNMIPAGARSVLRSAIPVIESTGIDFKQELGVFLPTDFQRVIKDFKANLLGEIRKNVG